MSDDSFLKTAFLAAERVAACPHAEICQAEFRKKGAREQSPEDRRLGPMPSPDFIGSRYRGLVVVGGNPGIASTTEHRCNDRITLDLQRRIALGDRRAFEELMRHLPVSMAHWKQVVDADGRRRLRYNIEEIAYVNLVKCGTRPGRGNTKALFSGTPILSRCWETHTKQMLDWLAPTHVVALWKPIIGILNKLGFNVDAVVSGYHNGARHLTKDQRYAAALRVFDDHRLTA